MNDRQRLNRVRWVQNSSAGEGVPAENNLTPWSAFPTESTPHQEEAPSVENHFTPWSEFQQGNAFGVENNPTPWSALQQGNATPAEINSDLWLMPPMENKPAPWTTPSVGNTFYQQGVSAKNYAGGEKVPFASEDVPADYDPLAEDFDDEDEAALLLEAERLREEAERHTLRDALLILIALYIVCGVAPLLIGLFVPLLVFFWLEIGGWAIIIAWLIIGVRGPLVKWFRERARKRKEQASEQVPG